MTKSNSTKSKPTTSWIPQQENSPLNDHLQFDNNQNSKEVYLGEISDILNQKIYIKLQIA